MTAVGRRFSSGWILGFVLVTSACDLSEAYNVPAFPFQPTFGGGQEGSPVLLSNAAWWKNLEDPVLDALVSRALAGNIDLEIARERVIAARAARDGVPTGGSITSSAQGQVSGSDATEPSTSATAQAGLNWVFDPYGTRREQLRSANARIDIADAERDASQLLLLFNLANTYVQLRYDQRVLELAHSELRGRRQTLELTRTLLEAEASTRLEVTRSEARVAEIRSRLPELEASVVADLNEIAVLVGAAPGTLPADLALALSRPGRQPMPSLSPDVGIPADLLRNRPDIRIAERNYYAAVAAIGIARADQYPRLSLSGTISLNALSNSGLGTDYFFGPLIQFPALPPGTARAVIETRHSEARQAHSTWIAAVLSAILEVENAMVRYDATATSLGSARTAARLYREANELTRRVFENDEATIADLIDAEQAVAVAERTVADLQLQHAQRFVALNVRLGAGHQADDNGALDGS